MTPGFHIGNVAVSHSSAAWLRGDLNVASEGWRLALRMLRKRVVSAFIGKQERTVQHDSSTAHTLGRLISAMRGHLGLQGGSRAGAPPQYQGPALLPTLVGTGRVNTA